MITFNPMPSVFVVKLGLRSLAFVDHSGRLSRHGVVSLSLRSAVITPLTSCKTSQLKLFIFFFSSIGLIRVSARQDAVLPKFLCL